MMPVSMVGRAGELAELDRAWSSVAAAERRAPTVAVLTGAAGVGKSLLVAAAVDALTPRPSVVLSGAARVHGPAPYDWLAAVLTGRDTGSLALPPDALAWLAQQPTAPRERYAPGTLLRLAVRTSSCWSAPVRRCWSWTTCTRSTRPASTWSVSWPPWPSCRRC
ncbi:ATP-binding protein [Micromonospora sp. NPDC005979]|uniref:ATP-binding protein n=1 Tax=Micromonospora sp. NPDC005979 TaxID=3156726 RepID=UPI0033BA015D